MATEVALVKSSTNKKNLIVRTNNPDVRDILSSLLCYSYDYTTGHYFIPIPEIYMVFNQLKKMRSKEDLEIVDDETEQEIINFKIDTIILKKYETIKLTIPLLIFHGKTRRNL
jgi:hypothetical protein